MPAVGIVGPGALGCFWGARWTAAHVPVRFLTKSEHQAKELKRRGFRIRGDWNYRVSGKRLEVSSSPGHLREVPFIFLCVKSYDTRKAVHTLQKSLAGSETIVSFQNGLDHVPILQKAFGPGRILLGTTSAAAFRQTPGVIHYCGGRRVLLGPCPRNLLPLLKELISRAGLSLRQVPSLRSLLWSKLILNAALNPLAALMGKTNGELAEKPVTAELLGAAAREGWRVTHRAKISILYSDPARQVIRLCKETSENINSMLWDLEHGRRTEADAILVPILEKWRDLRVPTPILERMYRWVKAVEKQT